MTSGSADVATALTSPSARAAFSALRHAITTCAPFAARAWADRRPNPLLAPVTTIVVPVWSGMSFAVHLAMPGSSHGLPARPPEAEQDLGDLAHLDLLGALGDAVAAVVAVDVLERHVPRVADAACTWIAWSAASQTSRFAR